MSLRRRATAGAAVALAVLAACLLGLRARADPSPAAPLDPQPQLGSADRQTLIMGAATAGDPGEAWAYRQLPLDVPPPSNAAGRLTFADAGSGSGTPPGQLVFERVTDAHPNWQLYETPLDFSGQPYRGVTPSRLSARITPHAGGLLLGADPTRPSGNRVVALMRDPGGRFRALPDPPSDVLLGAGVGGDPSAETLSTGDGTGRVADAVVESDGHSEAFFGALGRGQETAVVHWDGQTWTREPVILPAGYSGSFQIVALDGTAPSNLWLLALPDPASGIGIMLFQRTKDAADQPQWTPADLGAPLFSAATTPASGVSKVAPQVGPGQPLTVTEHAAWIDGSLSAAGAGGGGGGGGGGSAGGPFDFTLYYDIGQGKVSASWCDAPDSGGHALCSYSFGARFGRRAGYRSFAWDGPGFGTRVITNPLEPGGDDMTNMGTYLSLSGHAFQRIGGGGTDDAPSGAFSAPDHGWLEGPVQITSAAPPQRAVGYPVSARAPFTAVTPAPGTTPGDPKQPALAVGSDGVVARYSPSAGWQREFLLTSTGAVSSPRLRGVAWPEPGRAYAVGDLGAMWLWRAETGFWEKDPAEVPGFQGNLQGVAFDPGNPARGYAVGLQGVLLRYDKSWLGEPLPSGFETANFTSVAFSGSEALVAAGSDLLVNTGSGWQVDPGVHALLASLKGASPELYSVGGLPDGGAVVAGRDIVIERDGPSAPWHFSDQPVVGDTAVAAAAYRDGPRVRALLAVVPDFEYPPPLVLPPVDPNVPPPLIPPNPLPGDGYLLRETADGWSDEQRSAFRGVSSDKPVKADPVAALDIGPDGGGWAVGGWSGEPDAAGRGASGAGVGAQVREAVQTGAIYRYAPGGNAPAPPGTAVAPVALNPGVATFAVGGNAQCEAPCADLAAEGLAPDRNLTSALGSVAALAARPDGPRAFLYTGGREKPGNGAESDAEAARYAALLGQGGSLPVYPAVSAGDSEGGGASSFGAAFAGFAAPFGTAAAASGVDTSHIPGAPAGTGARTHYAFDSTGPTGTVRVVVIDNSRGSLAASDGYQNPPEAQGPWLTSVLADAKQRGIPAIVVGNRELNPDLPPQLNVASDAADEARLLLDGGASAYVYDRPEENRISQIPPGGATTIPELGSGALGYRSPIKSSFSPGQPDALFGSTGYLLVSVDAAHRNATSNVAPVTARLIPLIDGISLDPIDGTLLRRSRPALFQGLGRRPVAGDRWGPVSASDGNPNPPGADPYVSFPATPCLQSDCASAVNPEYTFTSSAPDIADFVAQDPQSTNLRKPLQGPDGKVVHSDTSDLLCAFNAGTTTVTVSAGGLSYSTQVTVLNGSVEQPCGTVPLNPSRFKAPSAVPVPPPPAPPPPAPAPAPAPVAPPPPPAKAPAPKPPPKPAPKLRLPPVIPALPAAVPLTKLAARGVVPAIPPPPAGAFARPIPPGGATVRVFEEKREEEAAPEQSQAFAAYRAAEHGNGPSPAIYTLLAVVIAAAAGASLRLGFRARRRERGRELALSVVRAGVVELARRRRLNKTLDRRRR